MRGVNKVILVGNIGSDPEQKFTQGGTAVTSVRLATTERYKDKSGNAQERTAWHSVKFFGRLGEIANEYLRKGSAIYVEGSIRYSEHAGQDGVKKYFTDILANEMRMLDGKREEGAPRQQRPAQQQRQAPAQSVNEQMNQDFADDDIPF